MSLHLSASDLGRIEAASRVMLSPLSSPTVDAWRSSVNAAVGGLFRGHKTIFMLPGYGDLYHSDDGPDVVDVMRSYVELAASGDYIVHDPVVNLWNDLRRRQKMNVFSWSINAEMIGQFGHKMSASEFTSLTVSESGSSDFVGLYSTVPQGEVLLWILLERPDVHPFGEHATMLLRALLPSLNAGLDALSRFNAHRQTLDAVSEPLIVFGRTGIERHRNSAFTRILEDEPERDRIMMEIRRLVTSIQPFDIPAPNGSRLAAAPQSTIRTAGAGYNLRASVVGSSTFDADAAILVSLVRHAPPTLPPAGVLRERFGLTDRESEVALLLAEGLSNTDIADRLFLSPHTARRHTANIFDKIGVSSRKALALRFLDI